MTAFEACGRLCFCILSNNNFLLTDSACTSSSTSTGTSAKSKSGDGLECFVHAVSPVKKANSSDRKYFNCTLQLANKSCRAVCFSPDKQSELKMLEQVKSPVKIQNYKTNQALNGKDEIILQKFTKFTPLAGVDFSHNKFLSAVGIIPNISGLDKLALEQLVSIKAYVAEVSNVKQIIVHGKTPLKKQEVLIADPTSCIKLVLWGDYVNSLEQGKTYVLENLRLKKSYDEGYLNTAKGEEFKIKVTSEFEDYVVEPDQPLSMDSTIPKCKVVGVLEATKQMSCFSCSKKVVSFPNSSLVQCTVCKMSQVKSVCKSQWYLRIMVQDSVSNPEKKVTLTLFSMQVEELNAALDLQIDLMECIEEQLLIAILTSEKMVAIVYDMSTHKVTGVKPVNDNE